MALGPHNCDSFDQDKVREVQSKKRSISTAGTSDPKMNLTGCGTVTFEKEAPAYTIELKKSQDPLIVLISFESGHYKKITGRWKGDSVWGHYYKENGKMVHINLRKVEYIEEL
jgi:hypothetical protein